MTQTTNCLGLNQFQITVIKGNYNSIRPILAKRDKLAAKIETAAKKEEEAIAAIKKKTQETLGNTYAELGVYQSQIEAIDKFTIDITKQTCGIPLSSAQCLEFLETPEKFEEYKNSLGLGDDLFNSAKGTEEEVDNN